MNDVRDRALIAYHDSAKALMEASGGVFVEQDWYSYWYTPGGTSTTWSCISFAAGPVHGSILANILFAINNEMTSQHRAQALPPPFHATVIGLTLEEGRTLSSIAATDAIRSGFRQVAVLPVMARNIEGYKKPQGLRSAVLVDSEYHIELLRNVWTAAFNDPRLDIQAQNYVDHPDVIVCFSETAAAAGVLKNGTCSIQYVASNPKQGVINRGWAKGAVTSVMAHAAKAGCDLAVLQTTSAGYPLYRHLGFSEVTRYHQFAGLI